MGENEEPDSPSAAASAPSPGGETSAGGRFQSRRSVTDRYLGGVAGGLAESLGVDPIIVRVGLAVATLWWPVVPILYVVLWLAMPEQGAERSLLRSWREPGHTRQVLGIVALGVGVSALVPDFEDGGLTDARVGVLLVVSGAVLVMGRWVDGRSDSGPGAGQEDKPAPASAGTDSTPSAMAPPADFSPGRQDTASTSRMAPTPRLALPSMSGALGWFCVWLVLLLMVGAVALDRAGTTLHPGVVVSLGLLVVAVGLLIASVRGRAPVLIPIGLALVPLWLAFAAGDVPRYDGDGTVTHMPSSMDALETDYTHGFGTMLIDLTEMDFRRGQTIDLEAGVTAGRLRLRVPRDVAVDVDVAGGLAHSEQQELWEGDVMSVGASGTSEATSLGGADLSAPAKGPFCEEWEVWYQRTPAGKWVDDAGIQLTRRELEEARERGRVVKEPVQDAVDVVEADPRPPDPGMGVPAEESYPGDPTYDAAVILRDWQTPDGDLCAPQPAPANPAVVNINATIGFGTVELEHVETPA